MQFGSFSLKVLDESLTPLPETAEGYVYARHGQVYVLEFGNHSAERANVYPKVDGLSVGDFQIDHGFHRLERPVNARQRFTFFASGTAEAQAVGEAQVAHAGKGLVEVTFVPPAASASAVLRTHDMGTLGSPTYRCASKGGAARGMSSGVTGLTGHSGQEFGRARPIVEDRSRAVVITLRLVCAGPTAVPLGPQPLPGRVAANPVPPPVGGGW